MLYIEDAYKKIIWDIIKKYPYTFYAFGSRVTGKHKKFSDLDIFIEEQVKNNDAFYIKDDFENSNLPFIVDVIQKQYCKQDFITLIKKDMVILNKETLGIKL